MDVYEAVIEERNAGRSCALATIVNVVGSIPSHALAKMLVRRDGSIAGTIGGGAAEAAVIREALEVIATSKQRMVNFKLHENPQLDIGMVCGGTLDVFIEPIVPKPVAYLFGAGHVGLLTAQIARLAGFEIEVIDDRPPFANIERFPGARGIHAGPWEETLAVLRPNASSLIFIATRDHVTDGRLLRWAVETPASYIGMIGSKRKVLTTAERMKADGASDEQLRSVHSPVGLAIGAITPEEIAVAVVAEMIAHRRGAEAARALMGSMGDLAAQIGTGSGSRSPAD